MKQLIYGKNAVFAALQNPSRKKWRLLITKERLEELMSKAVPLPKYEVLSKPELEKQLHIEGSSQGIALECSEPLLSSLDELMETNKCILLLDGITDPHNIGAIIRSAMAFDAALVVCSRRSGIFAPSVSRTSAGTIDKAQIAEVSNIAGAVKKLRQNEFWIAALDTAGDMDVAQLSGYSKLALILGAEGAGISNIALKQSDMIVRIPTYNKVESLNVSNAAAISLYAIKT